MKVGMQSKFGGVKLRAIPLAAVAAGVMLLSGFTYGGAQVATAPQGGLATAVAQAGPGCQNYTPTQLALDTTLYIAGDVIIVTGVVEPNDSVSATLSGGSISNLNLGSAVADATGHFSISSTLPNPIAAGTYTMSVTSTQCPNAGTLAVRVIDVKSSSCTASRATRTFYPGQRVNFSLFTPIYSPEYPVTMTLLRPSYSSVLYNGPWPSNDVVQFTIPATATPGSDYTLEQVGTRKNGKGNDTKSCPIWIEEVPASVMGLTQERSGGQVLSEEWASDASVKGESASRLAFTGGDAAPFAGVAAVLVVAGFALFRLRRRTA